MESWKTKIANSETVSFSELTETQTEEIKIGTEGSVKFWELTGKKQYEMLKGETIKEFLARINDPTKWLYGSEVRDHMFLREASMLPRFAHLARKAFVHFGGSHYNPHSISLSSEFHVRKLIQWTIEYKVQGKAKDYDWELINNFFMRVIYGELNLELPSDYVVLDREVLPELRSIYHGLDFETLQ